MTETRTDRFEAHLGTNWDISLSRPIALNCTPTVSFCDRLGYNCGIETYVKHDNRRLLTIRSRSGLPLCGSISVYYRPVQLSHLTPRQQATIKPAQLAS